MFFGDQSGLINESASVGAQFGMNPAGARLSGYEGSSLPASTYSGGDRAAVPWSLDSPMLWAAGLAALTLFGIVGASVHVRAGRASAQIGVNDK